MNNDPESVETEHEREQERKMRVAAGLTHPGSYACTCSTESVRRKYEQDPGWLFDTILSRTTGSIFALVTIRIK